MLLSPAKPPERKESTVITRFCIVALAASAGACLAQDADSKSLDRMIEHYQQLGGCSVSLGISIHTDDPMMAAMVASMNQSSPGYAVKPNLFAFWSEAAQSGDPMGMQMPKPSIQSDGERVTSAIDALGVYSVSDAPSTFDDMLADPQSGLSQGWQMIPGANFLFALMADDPHEALAGQLADIEYAGLVGEGEGAYHAYTTIDTEEGTSLEMRISAVGEPWLIGFKPDLSGSGAPEGLEMLLTFKDWAPITEAMSEGVVTINDEWDQVDDLGAALFDSMNGGAPDGAGAPDNGPEITDGGGPAGEGDVAPVFTLPRLGSDAGFSLADHKGKVVVLDFWATWCGPCIRGLPVVSGVTASYADKGVVFAAVDLQEDPEHVADFMNKKDWDFDVALDADGAVAGLFGVSGIPHSVVIDKKGVIRHVHIGFGGAAQYEKQLREELEALIAE
jgi:thiol-disulfide isomerase/thioredoxin